MSTIVEDIVEALQTQIEYVEPDLSRLDFVIDAQKQYQNLRSQANRYGVFPLDATVDQVVTNYYVVDHDFRVQLLREYANRGDDSNQRAVTYALYDDMDTIIRQVHQSRLACPDIIKNVLLSSISEPEFFEDSNVALLEAIFVIKYNKSTTWNT